MEEKIVWIKRIKGRVDYQVTELLFSYLLFINIDKMWETNRDNDK